MARDSPVRDRTDGTDSQTYPNLVTLVGRGVPSNFEITVDGDIEPVGESPNAEDSVVSGGVIEGTIDVGVSQFRFSGEMANIRLVDWNGVPAPDSPSTPTVHVAYGTADR